MSHHPLLKWNCFLCSSRHAIGFPSDYTEQKEDLPFPRLREGKGGENNPSKKKLGG